MILGGYGVYRYASRILKQDPLERFKKAQPDELPDSIAIRSTDTKFNHFDAGKPKTSCDVKTIEVAQNRQMYTFKGISNGKIEWKGATYNFQAERGAWNGFNKKMTLNGALKIKGKKFNLTSTEFNYDETRRLFIVPKDVKGTAFGGQLQAASFTYNLDSEAFKAGKGRWVGVPPQDLTAESPVQVKKTIWDIKYEDIDHPKGDITYYTDARATDGEIIITAPKIEVNEKTDVMTATGRVRYFGTKANLIADKIVVFRKEKRAVLTGNVTMLVKPKDKQEEPAKETELTPLPPAVPDSISSTRPPAPDDETTKKKEDEIRSMKNLRQYPLIVLAPKIEYWYKKGERRAVITGSPQARQDIADNGWRYVWSDHANYDGEKESLSLFSAPGKQDVILKNSIGDELYGESGVLSTKEDDDSYKFKKGRAKMPTREDDLPASDKDKKSTGKGGGVSGPIGRKV
jgi:LptA/(LptD N-terminal domain) LPS transport protein/Lipopolysaccharide-assembly, LptC-related